MGINLFRRNSNDSYPIEPYSERSESKSVPVPSGNPDPSNYEILLTSKIGNSLIVKIKYHDCSNYEGVKILVYHNVSIQKLMKQKLIDPHFSDNKKYISPVARFVPTDEGLDFARKFCNTLNQDK
jgi:hypothetical protein